MNFGFISNILPFGPSSEKDTVTATATAPVSTPVLMETPKQRSHFNVKVWGWSLMSVVSWAIRPRDKINTTTTVNRDKINTTITVNTELNQTQPRGVVRSSGGYPTIRFRPYVCKVPWHTGARAFLSQMFPRYGHYCGPNWSSGKDGGSLLWDKRPIDWLDFCCYCHDIGYDSHDQADLLKADMAFLECLERPNMSTKGDPRVADLYKTMCISGLRNILIPYRNHLMKLQSGQLSIGFGWVGNIKWKGWKPKNT
ncbi:hypothetical protein LguiA_021471 [Lonicera macranthoides]